jgi:hypothetical protein
MDDELEECGLEELYGITAFPQTEILYADKVRKIKDGLERVYRQSPDEFYRRKDIIKRAIQEREKGKEELMLGFSLDELRSILSFAERLYG